MKELPPSGSMEALWRDLLKAVNQLIRGGGNMSGNVTLTPNAGFTVVSNKNINATATIHLQAVTADAAAGIATTYVTSRSAGTFTIAHANNSQADRLFFWSCHGSAS